VVVKYVARLVGTAGMMLAAAAVVTIARSASAAPVVAAEPAELVTFAFALPDPSVSPFAASADAWDGIGAVAPQTVLDAGRSPVDAHLSLAPLASPRQADVPRGDGSPGPATASLVTSLLTDNSEPGVVSLIAMGAVLCRLGARLVRIKR
jgi:hypothetical protein